MKQHSKQITLCNLKTSLLNRIPGRVMPVMLTSTVVSVPFETKVTVPTIAPPGEPGAALSAAMPTAFWAFKLLSKHRLERYVVENKINQESIVPVNKEASEEE
jgi:hypothetical protein